MDGSSSAGVVRSERHGLRLSLTATVLIGGGALTWGILSGARVMVFDGIYTLAGMVFIWVSMLASRTAESAPTAQFPFGRHAAVPLAVALQGAALIGTAVYGVVDAAIVLSDGGSDTRALDVLLYGVINGVACGIVMLVLHADARQSALARAEFVAWRASTLLSGLVAVGGAIAVALTATGAGATSRYVDPVLVILASLIVVPMSIGLVRDGVRELLEAAPDAPLAAQIADAVRRGTAAGTPRARTLPAPIIRATKLGRRLYVEVDFVIAEPGWTVGDEDAVRRNITAHLDRLPYLVWANVEITTDPELAAD